SAAAGRPPVALPAVRCDGHLRVPPAPPGTLSRMASDPVLAGAAEPAAAATPDVTVVVPVLNEEATLQPLYDGVTQTLEAAGIAAELIFVDDGSTDGTFALLERLHDADPRVRVVSFKRNFGQHPAMHAGIARARGRIVVTMDGDLQNQPVDIICFVAVVDVGVDVASGCWVTWRDLIFLWRLSSLVINKLLVCLIGV